MAISDLLLRTSSPPLHSLPLHIVANLLVELGSVQHVPSALLSHPIFYAAFNDFPGLTREIVRSQLPDDEVYVLALLAHESYPARRRRNNNLDVRDFLEKYRDDPYTLVASHRYLRLTEALRIGELHTKVSELRDEYLRRTLSKLYGITVDGEDVAKLVEEVSPEEVRRVERALYRFQIYCNLFADKFRNGKEDAQSKRIFFDQYSSWANEQLGCVYDCLEIQLGEALDQVIDDKGDDAKFLIQGGKARRKQHYFSLGLPFLHQLATASTIDEKFEVLREATDLLSADVPTPISTVQNESKYREPESPSEWSIDVRELTFESDIDVGPRTTWENTHQGGQRDMFFFADHEVFLRRLGYVMWDQRRVDEHVPRESLAAARKNSTPTFLSASKLMNVARSWDKQFRPPAVVTHRPADPDRSRPP